MLSDRSTQPNREFRKKTTTKKFIFLNKEELGKISMTLINDPITWEYDICFPNIMITNLIDYDAIELLFSGGH